jgi:hypothetical protein
MSAVAERYRQFARTEAAGRSPLYETLAVHVAESPGALAFLDQFPPDRQQPNLFFAALRLVAGTPASAAEFDDSLHEHARATMEVMLSRTTQTNEPGRCATLLPYLSRIGGPLALIEVGASAGLCLLPDLYGYDWRRRKLAAPVEYRTMAPTFVCDASNGTPLPLKHPDIVWRAGLDLNPLDVLNKEDVTWLEHLIWPEHHERLARLRAAISIARINPPRIIVGDLRNDLPGLIASAPPETRIVVFHTAVLSYILDQGDRDDFARRMMGSRATWLSNESPHVFPQFAPRGQPPRDDMFLLAANGRPLAWTGPHGQSIRWLSTT